MASFKTEQNLINALKELCLGCEVDYHPLGGDIIYCTQEYFHAKNNNIPITGIKIINISNGKTCGFIHENKPTEVEWYDK